MVRLFRILGLVIVAALALGAFASAAQALEFTAEEYPAEFHGENAAGNEVFSTEAGGVECASTFSGELEEGSPVITVAPTYSSCNAFGFLSATVNTEECHYVFKLQEEVESHRYRADVGIDCPEEQSIKITAATCSAEVPSTWTKVELGGGAYFKVLDFLSHVTIEIETGAETNVAQVNATVGEIQYVVTNDGFLCPFGGTGPKTGGSYTSYVPAEITSSQSIHIG